MFALWYQPHRRPGTRRVWALIATEPTRQALYNHNRGSGEYLILPTGEKPEDLAKRIKDLESRIVKPVLQWEG